ncbi:head-tail joining protein [Pseudomonas sp. GM18]|uniref:head-tail joining protein n=1 Tax=Pseudomonas sp. GM18 TaxID=1144324 RepID=UPI0005191A2D|nr:hypothetical protein [Pseudomonas sp. GM18]
MAIDWDKAVLEPLEAVFGEGKEPDKRPMFYPAVGARYPIDGVFDAAYRDVDLADPLVGATSAQPVLGVRLSIFEVPPAQDDQVYIPSVDKRFLVMDVRPDSHGWAKLMLSEM